MNKNLLEIRTRENILRSLFSGDEKSAYKIAVEIGISTATVIGHLYKLEEARLISSRDGRKGKLIRRFYKITEDGKTTLTCFLKEYFDEIKRSKVFSQFF